MFLPTSELRVEANRIKPGEQMLEGSVAQVHRDAQIAINDKVEALEDLWNVWLQNMDLREAVGAIRTELRARQQTAAKGARQSRIVK